MISILTKPPKNYTVCSDAFAFFALFHLNDLPLTRFVLISITVYPKGVPLVHALNSMLILYKVMSFATIS